VQAYESIALQDIGAAAEQLQDVFESSGHRDGYVSLEVSPRLANDTRKTVAEADALANANAQTITDLQATVTAKDSDIEAAKNSAGQIATETLAAIGQSEPLEIDGSAKSDPVAEYIAAVESGDRAKAAQIFALHKTAIFNYRAKLSQTNE